ncbi:type VI secretion system-associated protein TagF [Marinobacter suaedae]|uniref:type VI secretion system-associated protein TagF n=1 Tax=Marinobacter suaedae TaxID=3057675 RepID=UPI003B968663
MSSYIAGFYGKLPSHGDFVKYRLPLKFVNQWDQWLLSSMSTPRFRERWNPASPTARPCFFYLSKGVIDTRRWQGALLPSHDLHKRIFPITIAFQVPSLATASSHAQALEVLQEWIWAFQVHEYDAPQLESAMQEQVAKYEISGASLIASIKEWCAPFSLWWTLQNEPPIKNAGPRLPPSDYFL